MCPVVNESDSRCSAHVHMAMSVCGAGQAQGVRAPPWARTDVAQSPKQRSRCERMSRKCEHDCCGGVSETSNTTVTELNSVAVFFGCKSCRLACRV